MNPNDTPTLKGVEVIQALGRVLRDMALLAGGSTGGAFDSVRVHGGETDNTPRGHSFRDRYIGERGELTMLVYKMQRDVEQFTHRKPGGGQERKEERNARIVQMYEGWHPTKVAVYEDLSDRQIRTIREEADRDALTGERR